MKSTFSMLLVVFLAIVLTIVSGCTGNGKTKPDQTIAPSETYKTLSAQIGSINPSSPTSLADIFGAAQDIGKAEGTLPKTETDKLSDELKNKFNAWTKETVDGIDPAKPESIKDFFDLQAVQGTSEYEEYTDPQTKQYKEEQMGKKFNEWVRNRVDEINPANQNDLKYFFWLQTIQQTEKYDELATDDTRQYKEEQMGEKFNEWVRNRVDEINPTNPNDLKYFFWLQTIQQTEKYDEFATPETHSYKESQLRQKFNEWVENIVNGLDPNDPDFLKNLEMLRVIQISDKYDKYINADIHQWKEQTLKEKMDTYVTNLLNGLHPLSPTLWGDLFKLIELQQSDVYKEFCPSVTKQEKQAKLAGILTKPLGPPPEVAGIYPVMGQVKVPLDQPIMVVFTQPMEPGSLPAAIDVSPDVMFTLMPMVEENFIVLLQPLKFLSGNTDYTITVNPSAVSLAGLPLLEAYEFSFKTKSAETAPVVTSTTPLDGTINAMAGQPIAINFDQRMATGSVESALSISPTFAYSVVWDNSDSTAIVQSHMPLDTNTEYTVTVGETATSADGVPLKGKYQFSFITGIVDQPVILGTMPDNGQDNIPSNHPIRIVFDRPMDVQSVEALLSVSPNFAYTTNWYEANMVIELVPASPLTLNIRYTVIIKAGALSSVGLPLEEDYIFSFST